MILADGRALSAAEHYLKAVEDCFTLYKYEVGLKRVIHDMKFRKAKRYGRHLNWLLETGCRDRSFKGVDAVVPVPLHADRLNERGFNQTELIFRTWAENRGLKWQEALIRIRKTKPQWELTLAERRSNIKGAFRVIRTEFVTGKSILLVDDIFTTGLTLDECAKELKKAGAKQVSCLTLASNAK